MAAVHQQFDRTLLRKVHLIKVKSFFLSIWPGFSPPEDTYCRTKSTRNLQQAQCGRSLAGSCVCVDVGLLLHGAFCRARPYSALQPPRMGSVRLLFGEAFPLKENFSLLTAANLCISAILNGTAHFSVAAKLYLFFMITLLWVNMNFLYLLHAKSYIMK